MLPFPQPCVLTALFACELGVPHLALKGGNSFPLCRGSNPSHAGSSRCAPSLFQRCNCFPFFYSMLPSTSTPLSLFTPCIPLLQRLLGPFCKGHLVGKAFVKRLAYGPRPKPKSCRHEHMWVVKGWGDNNISKVQLVQGETHLVPKQP